MQKLHVRRQQMADRLAEESPSVRLDATEPVASRIRVALGTFEVPLW